VKVCVEPLAVVDPLARRDLAMELQQRWFVWDAWVSGARRVDLHPIVLSASAHAAAARVAERAASLVARAADRAAADPAERARYRLHPDVERLAAAARRAGDVGSLVRVDLLLGRDGTFVACEVNADCPGGHNETIALPRLARLAGLRGHHDPTNVAERLAERLVALSGGPGSPRGLIGLVLATGYAEDLQVCALVERLVRERGGRARRIVATAPREGAGGRLVVGNEPLAVLYRFYPLEYMEGQANIEALARATERGDLASLSSFAAIHAQSKLAMARAWAEEPDLAGATFPETRAVAELPPAELLADRSAWVVKRDLSRVGDHVLVGAMHDDDAWRAALAEVAEAEASGEVWVAQRFAPQAPVATPWGDRLITLGVYLLDGVFAGYFARLSEASLCSHDALVLPVFVADAHGTVQGAERGEVAA
jgi:glutathionylspermidine synthase